MKINNEGRDKEKKNLLQHTQLVYFWSCLYVREIRRSVLISTRYNCSRCPVSNTRLYQTEGIFARDISSHSVPSIQRFLKIQAWLKSVASSNCHAPALVQSHLPHIHSASQFLSGFLSLTHPRAYTQPETEKGGRK